MTTLKLAVRGLWGALALGALGSPTLAFADEEPSPEWAQPLQVSRDLGSPRLHERAYGQRDLVEAGASAGLALGSHLAESVTPSIGWFFADNVELSALLDLTHTHAGDRSSTTWSALVEPSVHVPLTDTVLGFAGIGFGLAYTTGAGIGTAIQPRLGVNVPFASGIFTPSISLEYMTHGIDSTTNMMTTSGAEVPTVLRVNLGYAAMF